MEKQNDQTPSQPPTKDFESEHPPTHAQTQSSKDADAKAARNALLNERLSSIAHILPNAWNGTPKSNTDAKAVLAYVFDVVVCTTQYFDTQKTVDGYSYEFLTEIVNHLSKLDGEDIDSDSEGDGDQSTMEVGLSNPGSAVRRTREIRREKLRKVMRDIGRPVDVKEYAVPKSIGDLRADVKDLMRGP